jgi:hypothetical protein
MKPTTDVAKSKRIFLFNYARTSTHYTSSCIFKLIFQYYGWIFNSLLKDDTMLLFNAIYGVYSLHIDLKMSFRLEYIYIYIYIYIFICV